MVQEVKGLCDNVNFSIVQISQVLKGTKILPAAVWQMKRKRDVLTGASYQEV
jgi:hypothetical protein